MRTLEISDSEIMRIAIQQEIKRSEESRYDHRLHGLLLICEGYNSYDVSDIFGDSPRAVQNWTHSFEEKGFSGLREGERSGRPPKLDKEAITNLNKDLRKNPRDLGYSQNLWDGKLVSHHLKEEYDVKLCVRQCQRLFHTFGFRLRKPRPIIAKADEEKKTSFKKTKAIRKRKEV